MHILSATPGTNPAKLSNPQKISCIIFENLTSKIQFKSEATYSFLLTKLFEIFFCILIFLPTFAVPFNRTERKVGRVV